MRTTPTAGYLLQAAALLLVFDAGDCHRRFRQTTTATTPRSTQLTSVADAQCNGLTRPVEASTDERTLSFPSYPRPYPRNLNCSWLLVAPSTDYRIALIMLAVELESPCGCPCDNISIYDGYNTSSPLILTFCSNVHFFLSTGRYLLVVFMSDGYAAGDGFDFQFAAQQINLSSTTITTTTTTEEAATAANKGDSSRTNTWILIGSIVGGICVIVIIGVVCGRCLGPKRTRHPPPYRAAAFYNSHAPTLTSAQGTAAETGLPAMAASVHMVQNNNAVFMVSGAAAGLDGTALSPHLASALTGGVTNLAYSGSTDFAALTPAQGFLGPPIGVPPPSYTEAMLMTHSPVIPPSPSRSFATLHPPVAGSPSLGLSVPGSLTAPSGMHLNASSAFTVLPPLSTSNVLNGGLISPQADFGSQNMYATYLLQPPTNDDHVNTNGPGYLPVIPQGVVAGGPFSFPLSDNSLMTRFFPSSAPTSLGSPAHHRMPSAVFPGTVPVVFAPVVSQEFQTTSAADPSSQTPVSSSVGFEPPPAYFRTPEEAPSINLMSATHVTVETERPLTSSFAMSVQDCEQASGFRPSADHLVSEEEDGISFAQPSLSPPSVVERYFSDSANPLVNPSLSPHSLHAKECASNPEVSHHCMHVDDMGDTRLASPSHHSISSLEAEIQGYQASSTFWHNARAAPGHVSSRQASNMSHFRANPETGSSNPSPTTLAALEEDSEQGHDLDDQDFPDPPEFVLRPCLLEPETGIPCTRPVQPVPTSMRVMYSFSTTAPDTQDSCESPPSALPPDCQERPEVPSDDEKEDEAIASGSPSDGLELDMTPPEDLPALNADDDLGISSEKSEDRSFSETPAEQKDPACNVLSDDLFPPSPAPLAALAESLQEDFHGPME